MVHGVPLKSQTFWAWAWTKNNFRNSTYASQCVLVECDLNGAKLELHKFFDLGLAKTQLALGYPPFWEGGGKQA